MRNIRTAIQIGITVLCITTISFADSFEFTSEQTGLVVDGAKDTTVVLEAVVKNLTDSDITVQGVRSVISMPGSWSSRMCFGNCYDDETDKTDEVPIYGNDSMTFELDVDLSPETGTAEIEIEMKSGLESHILTFVVSTSAISTDDERAMITFALEDNYPNPFNPETNITYKLGKTANIDLAVYNLYGEKIKLLEHGSQQAGFYLVSWNGKDEKGNRQAAGVYYYRLNIRNTGMKAKTITKKMVLLK